MVWSFATKQVFSGAKTVKIASYLAERIFNEGYDSILKMMQIMNISIADARSFEASKEGRSRKKMRSDLEETLYEEEGALYEEG